MGVGNDDHFYGFYGFGCAGRRSFFQENRGVLLSWFGCFALLGDSRYGLGRRLALTGRSQPRNLRTNPDLWRARSLFREPQSCVPAAGIAVPARPKPQFSRDIAPASGYLMASGSERLYTAADRGDTFRIRHAPDPIVSPQTMKATRPINEWIQGT
jgi:hypothetical protein